MKILYGIQGTGHGHISRAREILPELSDRALVDVVLSGTNTRMTLDDHTPEYKRGISFEYDSKGSVSYLKSALKLRPLQFITDVRNVNVRNYDLVISDYEPVTAWAAMRSGVPSVALSHQAAFLSEKSPRPVKKNTFAELILKHFAPCHQSIGFHFQKYDSFILPPVIRSEIRTVVPQRGNHVTLYLPAYSPQTLIPFLKQIPQIEWHLFTPFCSHEYTHENVLVKPVMNRPFIESLSQSRGVITSAGFETCAEAMFLEKKLMVIPIKKQYEQYCNAAALKEMGVPVLNRIDQDFIPEVRSWLNSPKKSPVLHNIADMSQLADELLQLSQPNSCSNM